MLYVTTRNNQNTYTAQRTLWENRNEDGGLYLPFHTPEISRKELDRLLGQPFNQCVADILNVMFPRKLTRWDVDFSIGRYPVRLKAMGHRIYMAETWHNPDWDYDRVVQNLTAHLCEEQPIPTNWGKIAVRMAVLFGIYGELRRFGVTSADIAVVSGDFSAPISAWYARKWGLPVGNIVCCCNENNALWDLVCQGQMRTDLLSQPTIVPEADIALPESLERLILECGGREEVDRYLDACRKGSLYYPSDGILPKLRGGLFVSVVSSQRLETTVPSVYRTHAYLLSPSTALAYAGLQDYRAKTGHTRHAVILADKSPACDLERAARLLGLPKEEILNLL